MSIVKVRHTVFCLLKKNMESVHYVCIQYRLGHCRGIKFTSFQLFDENKNTNHTQQLNKILHFFK